MRGLEGPLGYSLYKETVLKLKYIYTMYIPVYYN